MEHYYKDDSIRRYYILFVDAQGISNAHSENITF